MAEYIERQKVFDSLPVVTEDRSVSLYGAVADFMVCVSAIPAADVAPVRHGRWEINELGYLVCTHCAWIRYGIPLVEHYPYCPNCGAKMDGADHA